MMRRALIILADGFEEMEAVAPIDLLRRAGVDVTVAGLETKEITGRNGLKVVADTTYETVADQEFDLLVLPGGPGHKALRRHEGLRRHLQRHHAQSRPLGAICAAPTVLHDAGLLENRRYTGHFSIAEEIGPLAAEAVVEDGTILTSQGAGTATRFGLALVERLQGTAAAREVAQAICHVPDRVEMVDG